MTASVFRLENDNWISTQPLNANETHLAICFASGDNIYRSGIYEKAREKFPHANVVICSSAGEICQSAVQDNSFVAAALSFKDTNIFAGKVNIKDYPNSYDAGMALMQQLPKEHLGYVLILSDGNLVNGSELAKGLNTAAGNTIPITGGLAGDGTNFNSTFVGLNEQPLEGNIVAVGFYGTNLVVTHGVAEGWQTFGLEKTVTQSEGNKLFKIDGKNALDIYKQYLGAEADNLPGSALFFPISVLQPGSTKPVVRTILSIDEQHNSMTFAGDIPPGSRIRFMKANFDLITAAAAGAASHCLHAETEVPVFSLLISCVGRKLVLGSRVEEEVEAVLDTFENKTAVAGFYSYGEISPFNEGGACCLHNQTMSITSFYELA